MQLREHQQQPNLGVHANQFIKSGTTKSSGADYLS